MKRPIKTRTLNRSAAIALRNGGVGIIPTDTLYGIVASASSRSAVARVYRLRRRDPKKPSIILISDQADLGAFGVRLTPAQRDILRRIWPGKFSVIFRVPSGRRYLDRGTGSLAFRLPRALDLRRFLGISGPLIAPSANFEGDPPALTVAEARKYFGDKVDLYVDRGPKKGAPSTVVAFRGRRLEVLRAGAGRLPKGLEYVKLQ
ncbi:L-threonylcarbamoyladenylate synthase [Patescibacteria group bacterium]|nr:L-threonylcarbamoyladenylate synthase [Patescibacteria group bacterium]